MSKMFNDVADALSDMIDLADAWASGGPEGYTPDERRRRDEADETLARLREHIEKAEKSASPQEAERPAWQLADPVATWLAIGQANRWIRYAYDPPFSRRSFTACADAVELEARLTHGNWCLGSAFYVGELCFIQQVNGGDEWLVIKGNVAFDSASCAAMIAAGTFRDFLSDVQAATLEQCASLTYRNTGRLA